MQNHAQLPTPGESAPQLAIDAVGLAKSFGGQHALTGLDLAVPEGSVTALIGPNGSGKTTTIRILSTLLAPDAGRVTVFGHDVVAEPEAVRAVIGVTGQFSAVDKFLTGRENLALMAGLHHLRRAVALERTARNLERFELTEAADRPVISYSGGMRRRLDLAMTLMGEPRIVFLDEPTTGLDPGARRDLWQYLQILRDEERVTVLVTTHLMEEAERCDRLAIYANGSVVGLGTPAELKSEIGGDVIMLESHEPDSLAQRIEQRFGLHPTVLDHRVRLEIESGHRFVTDVVEAFPGEIEGVSVHKPSLEDVFIRRTGHRFWTEENDGDTKE